MAKLSKQAMAAHKKAAALVALDRHLTTEEKWFVLENWNEGAEHMNGGAGAFFTPVGLASDFALTLFDGRVLDICAGIGALSFVAVQYGKFDEAHLTCLEVNPDYVAVGKKLLPFANWVCADAFELPSLGLGKFDLVISNPPFGTVAKISKAPPRYTGGNFELAIVDLVYDIAPNGAFILPQNSTPHFYSGRRGYEPNPNADKYNKFMAQTGIELPLAVGFDTALYADQWRGVSPIVEIVEYERINK